jgi:prepilin-type N-terminal cleavage/methylation domain-containing protein
MESDGGQTDVRTAFDGGIQPGRGGFTLIEMSIVLVVIGLLVGGVLVGEHLIQAALVRAQITQIEKFNTAKNTFYGKYGYLPGDIPTGAQYGFPASGGMEGEGDGNGLIEGYQGNGNGANPCGCVDDSGEGIVFWVDLSMSGFIQDGMTTGTYTTVGFTITSYPATLFPAAKINSSAFVFAWSYQGYNYFSIHSGPNSSDIYQVVTPNQAYAIDSKIDDGFPTSGRVVAMLATWPIAVWWESAGADQTSWRTSNLNLSTAALPSAATSCFDNANVAGALMQYSTGSSNSGNAVNCALSFQMQ